MVFANELGAFDLRDGKTVITPAEHFATEEEARTAIEPFLRAWEVATDLTQNPGTIRFTFVDSEIIDRDPPPPGSPIILTTKPARLTLRVGDVSILLTCHRYPEPPASFRTTSDVELAHRRWLGFRNGRESLQSMAYFVLTLLQTRAGGRREAARSLNVDFEVLDKVGYLSSETGNADTARKAGPALSARDLTGPERHWLDQVMPRLVLRLGEHAAGVPLAQITMASFPTI